MKEARISPEYLSSSVMYQLFLRAFTPEGTINAAIKLLPHLAEIGVDIVYLCPINTADDDMDKEHWSDRQNKSGIENPQNPYRMKDYFEIDPEYGTDDDLHAFINIAHQLGMSVMLDLVYLHCGPKAVFLEENPDFVKRDENGNIAFGRWHFPLLNFDNRKLREYLFDNMVYYVRDFGVDGYRCDVAPGVPLDFWEEARAILDDYNPDLIMLSEGEVPEHHDNAFDLSYSFSWANTVAKVMNNVLPASALRTLWEDKSERFPLGGFIRYSDNHDIANDGYDNRLETCWSQEANDAILLLNFTVDGVPMLYNGQEIADATRHSIYGNRFHSHGLCINWSKLLTVEGQARLEYIKKLTELRHETTSLSDGDLIWLDNSTPDQVVSFLRTPYDFLDEDDDDCDCDCDDNCECDCDDNCECDCDDNCDCECDCDCDDDYDDDDCDCGHDHDHDHGHESNVLVVINLSDKPIASTVNLGLDRGTLLNVKLIKDANYKPAGDHLNVNLLPYGFLVLEF